MVLFSREENISSFDNGDELLKFISRKSKNPSSTHATTVSQKRKMEVQSLG